MYTKKITLLLFSFAAHAQEERGSPLDCIARLSVSDVVSARKDKGMWGTDYDACHAGWYDGIHPQPLSALDKDTVMTPYWREIEQASPRKKVWALFIACATNGSCEHYLNFRNNVAAALYCNPDERALPIIQEEVGAILGEATFKNDTALVSLLLAHKANVHEYWNSHYPIERARTVEMAKILVSRSALDNANIRPLHAAMFCLCEPALIPFYQDEHTISAMPRDRHGWSPLMHLALSLNQQSIEMIVDKAERLLKGLDADQRIALITMESKQGTAFDFITSQKERHTEFLNNGTFLGSKKDAELSRNFIRKEISDCDRLHDFLTSQLHAAQAVGAVNSEPQE